MDERTAMRRALVLARRAERTSPNPKVGCVILDPAGNVVGEGFHRRAGLAHAEVEALRTAGERARGGTAVVTLEPCNHRGRTGPCSRALIEAGVVRVVVGRSDPNPEAGGGAEAMRAAGLDVVQDDTDPELADLNRYWEQAVRAGRPTVIWKVAATLDARVAAADATSRWITGPQAREQVHRLRAEVDAVMVGTGTVLADDPQLTVRTQDAQHPVRVVVGTRALPAAAKVLDNTAPTLLIRERRPQAVLGTLWDEHIRSVLLEGGPTLASAFLAADLVDRVIWYTAPLLFGSGTPAVADLGVATLAAAFRFRVESAAVVGADVRIDLVREA